MKPVWISHRGIREQAIENTADAFRRAVELGFAHLETDLRTTKDGEIVLCHDPDLLRMTGKATVIAETSAAALREMELIDGQRLLFLDDFLDEFAGCSWTFDVKPETARQTVDALVRWMVAKQAVDWIMEQARFLFWNAADQGYLTSRFQNAVCLARQAECYRAGMAVLCRMPLLGKIKKDRVYSLPPRFMGRDLFTRSIARAYQERGAKVLAYLPATEAEARQAIEAGFDEILTNHPIVD